MFWQKVCTLKDWRLGWYECSPTHEPQTGFHATAGVPPYSATIPPEEEIICRKTMQLEPFILCNYLVVGLESYHEC